MSGQLPTCPWDYPDTMSVHVWKVILHTAYSYLASTVLNNLQALGLDHRRWSRPMSEGAHLDGGSHESRG